MRAESVGGWRLRAESVGGWLESRVELKAGRSPEKHKRVRARFVTSFCFAASCLLRHVVDGEALKAARSANASAKVAMSDPHV